MNDHAPTGLLWARLFAAVALVGIVVGVTAVTFGREGLASATGWFQLMQGVGGVALGWLFTSQGMDAALLRAAEEARQAEHARIEGSDLSDRLAAIEERSKRSATILRALLADPTTRQKVEEIVSRLDQETQ